MKHAGNDAHHLALGQHTDDTVSAQCSTEGLFQSASPQLPRAPPEFPQSMCDEGEVPQAAFTPDGSVRNWGSLSVQA